MFARRVVQGAGRYLPLESDKSGAGPPYNETTRKDVVRVNPKRPQLDSDKRYNTPLLLRSTEGSQTASTDCFDRLWRRRSSVANIRNVKTVDLVPPYV